MINPNFSQTITLYHLIKTEMADTWSRTVISECSIVTQIRQSVSGDNTISVGRSFTVRIPKKISINNGDIIVIGAVEDEIGDFPSMPSLTAPQLLQKYLDTSFQVRAVADNTMYTVPHMKVVS